LKKASSFHALMSAGFTSREGRKLLPFPLPCPSLWSRGLDLFPFSFDYPPCQDFPLPLLVVQGISRASVGEEGDSAQSDVGSSFCSEAPPFPPAFCRLPFSPPPLQGIFHFSFQNRTLDSSPKVFKEAPFLSCRILLPVSRSTFRNKRRGVGSGSPPPPPLGGGGGWFLGRLFPFPWWSLFSLKRSLKQPLFFDPIPPGGNKMRDSS